MVNYLNRISHQNNTQLLQDPKKVSVQNLLREARSNQRRLATAFGDLDTGELLKFNQLKVSLYLWLKQTPNLGFRYAQ